MTFDYAPHQLADTDHAPAPVLPSGPAGFANALVGCAMVLVAVAGATALIREAGWQPSWAAALASAAIAIAGGIHTMLVRSGPKPGPAVRQKKRRPRPAADTAHEDAPAAFANGPGSSPALSGLAAQFRAADPRTVELHSVEPSDLALALLAEVSAERIASFDPAHAPPRSVDQLPDDWMPAVPQATADAGAQNLERAAETELERVDRLVRRLADQVNQVHAQRMSALSLQGPDQLAEQRPAPALPFQEQLSLFPEGNHTELTASINALRNAGPLPGPSMPLRAPVIAAEPVRMNQAASHAAAWQQADQLTEALRPAPRPRSRADEIVAALNAQRIDVSLEPILDLEGQRPQHYEVSINVRAPGGQRIDLSNVATDLSGTGVLPLLDQARIARAKAMARRLAERGKAGSVFAELNGETLDDDGFQQSVAADSVAGAFPGQLVLALPQAHVRMFAAADWQTLERLRAAGFGFALTDVTGLDMDFEGLAASGFSFARLDAATFLTGLPISEVTVAPAEICRHLAGCGLSLIVGGIRDDLQLAQIFGFGVLFGQGQLFGGPRPVKAAPATGLTAQAAVAAE